MISLDGVEIPVIVKGDIPYLDMQTIEDCKNKTPQEIYEMSWDPGPDCAGRVPEHAVATCHAGAKRIID